jgi:phage N-6-adenine-methyltransferase
MRTPRWLFDMLADRFGPFALDAAASSSNALCAAHYTKDDSGLLRPWFDVTFCNPPFNNVGPWVSKAIDEQSRGVSSLLILPVGCSQRWFHEAAQTALIYFPTKRISFDNPDGTPTRGADRDTVILHFPHQSAWGDRRYYSGLPIDTTRPGAAT